MTERKRFWWLLGLLVASIILLMIARGTIGNNFVEQL